MDKRTLTNFKLACEEKGISHAFNANCFAVLAQQLNYAYYGGYNVIDKDDVVTLLTKDLEDKRGERIISEDIIALLRVVDGFKDEELATKNAASHLPTKPDVTDQAGFGTIIGIFGGVVLSMAAVIGAGAALPSVAVISVCSIVIGGLLPCVTPMKEYKKDLEVGKQKIDRLNERAKVINKERRKQVAHIAKAGFEVSSFSEGSLKKTLCLRNKIALG